MAIDLGYQDTTSEGPLDVAKAAGSEEGPITFAQHSSESEPLEANSDSEIDVLRRKNPLGYTITKPTEDEIDTLDEVKSRDETQTVTR